MGIFSFWKKDKEEEQRKARELELQRIKEEAIREAKEQIRQELMDQSQQEIEVVVLPEEHNSAKHCPCCNRPDYLRKSSLGDYCVWCGTVFNSNGQPSNVTYRPHDYFRYIWDISNVIKYDTLSRRENNEFLGIIFNNIKGCDIKTKVNASEIAPNAPEYAMPINFLITRGNKRVAVLLVEGDKCKRYSVLETMELCKENGIKPLRFVIGEPEFFTNEEQYVTNRIMENLL